MIGALSNIEACANHKQEQQLESLRSATSNRVRWTCVSLCTVLLALFGITSIATATPPTREDSQLPIGTPFIFQDTLGNNPCGFPVQVTITANKEVITTFTRQNGVTSINTTGDLKVQLMNTARKNPSTGTFPALFSERSTPTAQLPRADLDRRCGSLTQVSRQTCRAWP